MAVTLSFLNRFSNTLNVSLHYLGKVKCSICQICLKSVEFYESYGKTHFGVFFMPHGVNCVESAKQPTNLVAGSSRAVRGTELFIVVW